MSNHVIAAMGVLLVSTVGCGGGVEDIPPPLPPSAKVAVETPMPKHEVREGALVTFAGTKEIGKDTFRDDGITVASDVTFVGQPYRIEITRAPRHVKATLSGKTIESEVPADTVVLENGNWAAYAVAAEWFSDAREPKPVKVMLPLEGASVPGTITVRPSEKGGREVIVAIKATLATVQLDANGVVVHAEVPSQSIEVRAASDGPPKAAQRRPAPATVSEEPFEATNRGTVVKGVIWSPRDAAATGAPAKPPIALIIAGSGPTDRDGNSGLLKSDAYRMLAEALAARGIATARFDKRGVGESELNFDPTKLTLDDFVADAAACVEKLRASGRFGAVTVIGHSEGGLIALELATRPNPPDRIVLISTAGRPLGELLIEQITKQDKTLGAPAKHALDAIRKGVAPDPLPEPLPQLFPPSVRLFLKSEIDVDPLALLRKTKMRAAIVQGEHDVQVTVLDAKKLAGARGDAKLTLLPTMNHVLKDEASAALPQASYLDPNHPLAPGLVDAVASLITSH